MRTVQELIAQQIDHDDMTQEEGLAFTNYWFDKYEAEGFAQVFCTPYESYEHMQDQKYTVLRRSRAYSGTGPIGFDEVDLCVLPQWIIQFEDGTKCGAYPEEIIPSEIRGNVSLRSQTPLLEKL